MYSTACLCCSLPSSYWTILTIMPVLCPFFFSSWQCSVTCGVGEAQRSVGCRMDNGSLVEASFCAGQERPATIQQCVERPCPTDPPVTTPPPPTTEMPSTLVPPHSTAQPSVAALAGYRPQVVEIRVDPSLNSLDPASWNPNANDVPRTIGTWRTGSWGEVRMKHQFKVALAFATIHDLDFGRCSVRPAAMEGCGLGASFATIYLEAERSTECRALDQLQDP